MRLRKRIERSPWVAGGIGGGLAAWFRLCDATSTWERRGEEAVAAALAKGPVVVAFWHEMLAMPGLHWRAEWGPISALHTTKFSGRIAGVAQARAGLSPIAMAPRGGNLAASREVLRRLKGGTSVGLTADGPHGPRRVLKDAPLEWARATGRPVFTYAFAQAGARRLGTWDRMVWPRPFAKGACVWRLWREDLPRRAGEAEMTALRADLSAALDSAAEEAEGLCR